MPTAPRWPTFLSLLLIVGLAFAFAWPTRNGDFLFGDDTGLVLEHVYVNHPSWANAWRLLTMTHSDLYQPLPMLSFQLNYALAGPDPSGRFLVSPFNFHLTNIVLHVVNCLLVFFIVLRLARPFDVGCRMSDVGCREENATALSRPPSHITGPVSHIHPTSHIRHPTSFILALLTAAMFAVHPLAMAPVAWITGRMILMATAFSLGMILVILHRPEDAKGHWPITATILWILSLISKVFSSVPIAAAWCDWHAMSDVGCRVSDVKTKGASDVGSSTSGIPHPTSDIRHPISHVFVRPRRWWLTFVVLMALALGGTWFAVHVTDKFGLIEITQAEMTTSKPVRMLLASRYYLENYLWPTRMSSWSPPPKNVPFFSWQTQIAVLEWLALGAIAWICWRRCRLVVVGLGLYVLLLAPFLAATAVRNFLTADRYMYLPMLGLHLAAAAGIMKAYEGRRKAEGKRKKEASMLLRFAFFLLLFSFLLAAWLTIAWRQAHIWSSTIAQGERAMEIYPDSDHVRAILAKSYLHERQPEKALGIVAEARKRWPDSPRLAIQAGEAYRDIALRDLEHPDRAALEMAAQELERAVRDLPDNDRCKYYLGLTLDELGRTEEARKWWQSILDGRPSFLPAVTAMARSYRMAGDFDSAVRWYETAVDLNSFHVVSHRNLAEIMIQRGNWTAAEKHLRGVLDLDPADPPARLQLGALYARTNRSQEALALYDALLAGGEDAPVLRLNRALLLKDVGRDAEAETDLRAALKLQPDQFEAAKALHLLLQRQRRYAELPPLWETVANSVSRNRPSTQPDHTPIGADAWRLWAATLADQSDLLDSILKTIAPDRPIPPFADWALAYHRLRHGQTDVLLTQITPWPDHPRPLDPDEAECVGIALADLPPTIRDTAPAYTLAALWAAHNNPPLAPAFAEKAATANPDGPWAALARPSSHDPPPKP